MPDSIPSALLTPSAFTIDASEQPNTLDPRPSWSMTREDAKALPRVVVADSGRTSKAYPDEPT